VPSSSRRRLPGRIDHAAQIQRNEAEVTSICEAQYSNVVMTSLISMAAPSRITNSFGQDADIWMDDPATTVPGCSGGMVTSALLKLDIRGRRAPETALSEASKLRSRNRASDFEGMYDASEIVRI
jgi:hypothetical protein